MPLFNHPKDVCMTYLQHTKVSLYFSYLFLKGSFLAVVHAIIPDIAVTSTTDTVKEVSQILSQSGCHN